MKAVIRLWKFVSYIGVSPNLSASEYRRTRLLNQVGFFTVLLLAPYVFTYIEKEAYVAAWVQGTMVGIFFLGFYMNAIKNYNLARYILIVTGLINVAIIGHVMGFETGEHLAVFPITMFIFMVFDSKQKIPILICSILAILSVTISFADIIPLKKIVLSPEKAKMHYYQSMGVTFALLISVAYYFQSISNQQLLNVVTRHKQQLEAIFTNSIDAIFLVDIESKKIVSSSNQARQWFKPTHAELDELPIAIVLDEQISLLDPILTGEVDRMEQELILYTQDKHSFWCHLACSRIDVVGEERILIRIADISDRKAVERELIRAKDKAEEATLAKTHFLSTMSHEIRTPMNAVIGMTSLLLETPLNEEQKEYVETMKMSGDNLLAIINDILDFSKIESGKMELEESSFFLHECIEDVLDILANKAIRRGLELIYWIDPKVPKVMYADIMRLQQVLLNLGSNAIKFTEKGEVFFQVKHIEQEGKNHRIRVSVKDTGIGIPQDKLHRLFKSFSQVDASNTRKYGGTGLGLAICKKLVELMSGKIWVESIVGKGSTFYFTILVQEGNPLEVKEIEAIPPALKAGANHILIVDDNHTNLKILQKQISQFGPKVTATDSPLEALEILEHNSFDLAILDMQMPHMDGLTLAKKFRKQYTRTEMPLMLLSSHAMSTNAAEILDVFDIALNKPVRQATLFRTLSAFLQIQDEIITVSPSSHLLSAKVEPPQPILPQKEVKQVEAKPVLEEEDQSKNVLNVLIAEDNKVNQKVASRILGKLGIEPKIANNGVEALQMLEQEPFDLIFMDIQMPEMDGLTATKEIRKTHSKAKGPVIIAMTANAMDSDREACMNAGMDDFIAKPVKKDLIKDRIEYWSLQKRKYRASSNAS